MGFYVVFQKELDRGKFLPRYQILSNKPDHDYRVFQLEDGDCIDAADLHFGDDTLTWVRIDLYRISNINGSSKVDFLESYTMPYVR